MAAPREGRRFEVTSGVWRTDLRIADDVENAASRGRNLISFCVEDGRPGVQV